MIEDVYNQINIHTFFFPFSFFFDSFSCMYNAIADTSDHHRYISLSCCFQGHN